MSYVFTQPQAVATTATDVAGIGSAIREANAAAAAPTTGVMAAAQDEVSASISALFSSYGQAFQALSAQAATFHDQFVQTLTGAGGAYSLTEAANAPPLLSDLEQDERKLENPDLTMAIDRARALSDLENDKLKLENLRLTMALDLAAELKRLYGV